MTTLEIFMSCLHKKIRCNSIIVSQEESMSPFSKTEWMKPEREQGSRLVTGSTCRPMYVYSYMQEHKKGTQAGMYSATNTCL